MNRVLLGIGEAGYYAGMIYYLSFWYQRYAYTLLVVVWVLTLAPRYRCYR